MLVSKWLILTKTFGVVGVAPIGFICYFSLFTYCGLGTHTMMPVTTTYFVRSSCLWVHSPVRPVASFTDDGLFLKSLATLHCTLSRLLGRVLTLHL